MIHIFVAVIYHFIQYYGHKQFLDTHFSYFSDCLSLNGHMNLFSLWNFANSSSHKNVHYDYWLFLRDTKLTKTWPCSPNGHIKLFPMWHFANILSQKIIYYDYWLSFIPTQLSKTWPCSLNDHLSLFPMCL